MRILIALADMAENIRRRMRAIVEQAQVGGITGKLGHSDRCLHQAASEQAPNQPHREPPFPNSSRKDAVTAANNAAASQASATA